MATRLFPDDQMERLRSYPDIGTDELIRFFTLTPADVAFVDPGRSRGPADRRAGRAVVHAALAGVRPGRGACGTAGGGGPAGRPARCSG
jgi:hypothetical protein